jgi:CRP/FNR family transcriptional regulator, anaerobic regulatory protein
MFIAKPTIRCETCTVRRCAICARLTRAEIDALALIAHQKTVSPRQFLLKDQEQPAYFANIISGVVKLTKTLTDGREQIVGLQFATDFLGRPYRSTSSYNIEAVTEVHLCAYERRQFERLLVEFPGLQGRLFEHTLDELDAAREWMLLLGRKSAEERVASFLLMVAHRINAAGFDGQTARFDCPITRDEIADFLGLRIETVSRQLSRFRARKIIAVEGMRTIIVLDKYRLEQASEVTNFAYYRA